MKKYFHFFINLKGSCILFHISQRKIPLAFLFVYHFININLGKLLWICFLYAISGCIQDSSIAIKNKNGCFEVPVVRHNRTYQKENMVEAKINPPGCVSLPIWDYYFTRDCHPSQSVMWKCQWKAAMGPGVIKTKRQLIVYQDWRKAMWMLQYI